MVVNDLSPMPFALPSHLRASTIEEMFVSSSVSLDFTGQIPKCGKLWTLTYGSKRHIIILSFSIVHSRFDNSKISKHPKR